MHIKDGKKASVYANCRYSGSGYGRIPLCITFHYISRDIDVAIAA